MRSNQSSDQLYTYITDWKGGTFVSQNSEKSLDSSISSWAHGFDLSVIGASNQNKDKFLADILSEQAVSIDGLKNIWCVCPFIEGELATIHIVAHTQ